MAVKKNPVSYMCVMRKTNDQFEKKRRRMTTDIWQRTSKQTTKRKVKQMNKRSNKRSNDHSRANNPKPKILRQTRYEDGEMEDIGGSNEWIRMKRMKLIFEIKVS